MSTFEKRVDAAVAEYDRHFSSRTQTVFGAGMRRTAMAEAIRAADAVVTEEMIAETILKALVFTNENSKPWADGLARDIAALLRGGAK